MRYAGRCIRGRVGTSCWKPTCADSPSVTACAMRPSVREPARAVLQRLSDGTGIPVEQLEQMTFERSWDRLMDELRRIAATPEGRAVLERYSGWRGGRRRT